MLSCYDENRLAFAAAIASVNDANMVNDIKNLPGFTLISLEWQIPVFFPGIIELLVLEE